MKIYFLSRDANWQHYRNETLTYLGRKHNIKVEILTTDVLKSYLKENNVLKYKIFKNWFSQTSKFNFFPGALVYILKNKPDCVLALNNTTNLTEYLCVLLCRIMNIRFVWWTHAYDHKPIKNRLKRIIKNLYVLLFLKFSNSIITFSESGKKFLISKHFNSENIYVAPNTLDTEKLKETKETIAKSFIKQAFIKQAFGNIPSSSKFLLFSGRINHYKKVHNLINCLKILLEKQNNIHLIIIGEGHKKHEIVSQTEELGLTHNVHFLGAMFDQEEVGQYFMLSDLFIIPGLVGLAIVHAFSYGKPLITENINYHSPEIQYLKDGQNGFLVGEDNIREMANIILQLLNDDEMLLRLSKNALQTIQDDANISNMAAAMYNAMKNKANYPN